MTGSIRRIMLAAAFLLLAIGRAPACTVCIPFPEVTAADRLMAAETVVLARENPEKPFSFIAVEVLKGALEAPEIDLYLNAATRRRLARNPERAVILWRDGPAAPAAADQWPRRAVDIVPSTRTWRSLGYASARYEAMVRTVLDRAPQWQGDGASDRIRFFMSSLADPDRTIRELAYLEVGRAPYDEIRVADHFVAPSEVRKFLSDPRFIEWHPLYILLLGVNATSAEKAAIRAQVASRARYGTSLNLAAWATAFIEIDRAAALDWLDAYFLGRTDRDPTAIAEILKALSVHGGVGNHRLRPRIAESYATILETHPGAAGQAAIDLLSWQDWRFTSKARALLSKDGDLDAATVFALTAYTGAARQQAQ